MTASPDTPETRVLAIASHVVSGYVGNSCATLVLQSLGHDVSALNTVQFSNHTGYRLAKGPKIAATDILEIYDGLKQNYLNDFDVALTGYAPSADAVKAIRTIVRDLKLANTTRPGAFFWFLDPVMGDEGKLYVSEDVPPVYRNIMRDADMIMPNQYEVEVLSEIKVDSFQSLLQAITALHNRSQIAHILVTSVHFGSSENQWSLLGSSMRSDMSPRVFKIEFPRIDCMFSGSGDLFASLMVANFRQQTLDAGVANTKSWVSPDEVEPLQLPLARAVEKALASTQAILQETVHQRDKELESISKVLEREQESEKRVHVRKTKAAELRLVRNLNLLREPGVSFHAANVE